MLIKLLLLLPLFAAGITLDVRLWVVLQFVADIVGGCVVIRSLLPPPDEPNDDNVECCILFAVEPGADADASNCCGVHSGDNSCRPSNFSSSFGSLAPGKSCLFANINIGTPCR